MASSLPLLLAGTVAVAQGLEEIVVTAQKREQTLQNVGISVTAFSQDQMQQLGFESSVDLVEMTPGVTTAGSYGGQFLTFSIRGVTQNDFLDHTEAPNSVYVDEAYLAMMTTQQFALFDLKRVEILKGPQGTLFGRNSTGGTVNFVTNKPTEEPEGYANLTYGRYDRVRFEGAVGGALADSVNGRLALVYSRQDEILENVHPTGQDEWNDDTFAGRVHLAFDLSEDADLLLTGYGGRMKASSSPWQSEHTAGVVNQAGQLINTVTVGPNETRECIGPGGANVDCGNDVTGVPDGITLTRPVPGGDFFGFVDPDGRGVTVDKDLAREDVNRLHFYGGTANLTWELDDLTLTSVTDYKVAEKDFQLDGNASPARGISTIAIAETESVSQELRLMRETDRLRWILGGYYLHINADVPTTGIWLPVDGNTPTILFSSLGGFQFLDEYTLETDSYSAFGQIEYDLSSEWTLIGGIRITQEEKDFDYRSDVFVFAGPALPREFVKGSFLAPTRQYSDDSSSTLITARAELDWRPREDLLVYASYNRGVKAGGFNAPFAGSAIISDAEIPYDEEVLNAYEIGFKSTLFRGTTRLNGAFYYYDYNDYQTFQFVGLTSQVTNNDAEYKGAELELQSQPVEGLNLRLSASYLDTEVANVFSFGITSDKETAFAPEFQASGVARYEWPARDGVAFVQGEFRYSSSYFFSLTNFDSLEAGDYVVGNARVGYQLPGGHWSVSAFVENIADERYHTLGFDLSTSCGCSLAAFSRPRIWGINVGYEF